MPSAGQSMKLQSTTLIIKCFLGYTLAMLSCNCWIFIECFKLSHHRCPNLTRTLSHICTTCAIFTYLQFSHINKVLHYNWANYTCRSFPREHYVLRSPCIKWKHMNSDGLATSALTFTAVYCISFNIILDLVRCCNIKIQDPPGIQIQNTNFI